MRSTPPPPRTGRSSDKHRPTPTSVDGLALTGPSSFPDPEHNAYRKDLADVALADRVIASHYAEPVERVVAAATPLRDRPTEDSTVMKELRPGESFAMFEESVGWAWGYAGKERRVGYVKSEALAPSP